MRLWNKAGQTVGQGGTGSPRLEQRSEGRKTTGGGCTGQPAWRNPGPGESERRRFRKAKATLLAACPVSRMYTWVRLLS